MSLVCSRYVFTVTLIRFYFRGLLLQKNTHAYYFAPNSDDFVVHLVYGPYLYAVWGISLCILHSVHVLPFLRLLVRGHLYKWCVSIQSYVAGKEKKTLARSSALLTNLTKRPLFHDILNSGFYCKLDDEFYTHGKWFHCYCLRLY